LFQITLSALSEPNAQRAECAALGADIKMNWFQCSRLGEHFITEIFQFLSEMQHTAHEIMDHLVISRVMAQCFFNLIFENFLPPLKNGNMVWFRHMAPSKRLSAMDQSGQSWTLGRAGPLMIQSEHPEDVK
jgi:hypothetical protein